MSDDRRLVEATVGGDATAFERLVRKYQSLVCGITFSGTGHLGSSEDLAQETFLQAWQKLTTLKELDKFQPWLCAIARNLVRVFFDPNSSGLCFRTKAFQDRSRASAQGNRCLAR